MRLPASEIATVLGGRLIGSDAVVSGATQDSRAIEPGQLFVPLIAERDGHDFIADAIARGAGAYLTAREPLDERVSAVCVADTADALAALGRLARDRFGGPVVAVTGSAGKTSTKDLTASALGSTRLVHASHKSFNNEIGVPLTMFNAPEESDAWVLEMGARGPGHIRSLSELARPTIGIVTIVAEAHVELFGSLAAIARAKGELIEALPVSGAAVLNTEDPLVRAMASRTAARVITYGDGGDVRASAVEVHSDLTASFVAETPWGRVGVELGARGRHNVANALAALSVAGLCDVPLDQAAAALARPRWSPWRMELLRTPAGVVVLNDSYNANPASMAAALASLAELPARRRVAVLGPMAELGEAAAAHHRRAATQARERGIEVLAYDCADYGVAPARSLAEVIDRLRELGDGDAVLVKASRVAGLERLVELLVTESEAAG